MVAAPKRARKMAKPFTGPTTTSSVLKILSRVMSTMQRVPTNGRVGARNSAPMNVLGFSRGVDPARFAPIRASTRVSRVVNGKFATVCRAQGSGSGGNVQVRDRILGMIYLDSIYLSTAGTRRRVDESTSRRPLDDESTEMEMETALAHCFVSTRTARQVVSAAAAASPEQQYSKAFITTRLITFVGIVLGYSCFYLTRNSLTYTAPAMVADAALGISMTDIGALTRYERD